jgi:hypothetical protein
MELNFLRLGLTDSDIMVAATAGDVVLLSACYSPSDGTNNEIVSATSQLSFIQPHGDVLTPVVLTGSSGCNTCVAASAHENVTDTSFSFRGLNALTTITSIRQPFPVGDMHFQVWTLGGGGIEITRGASDVGAVPEPSTWAMMILGFAGVSHGVSPVAQAKCRARPLIKSSRDVAESRLRRLFFFR